MFLRSCMCEAPKLRAGPTQQRRAHHRTEAQKYQSGVAAAVAVLPARPLFSGEINIKQVAVCAVSVCGCCGRNIACKYARRSDESITHIYSSVPLVACTIRNNMQYYMLFLNTTNAPRTHTDTKTGPTGAVGKHRLPALRWNGGGNNEKKI